MSNRPNLRKHRRQSHPAVKVVAVVDDDQCTHPDHDHRHDHDYADAAGARFAYTTNLQKRGLPELHMAAYPANGQGDTLDTGHLRYVLDAIADDCTRHGARPHMRSVFHTPGRDDLVCELGHPIPGVEAHDRYSTYAADPDNEVMPVTWWWREPDGR